VFDIVSYNPLERISVLSFKFDYFLGKIIISILFLDSNPKWFTDQSLFCENWPIKIKSLKKIPLLGILTKQTIPLMRFSPTRLDPLMDQHSKNDYWSVGQILNLEMVQASKDLDGNW